MISCFTACSLVVNATGRTLTRSFPLFRETIECVAKLHEKKLQRPAIPSIPSPVFLPLPFTVPRCTTMLQTFGCSGTNLDALPFWCELSQNEKKELQETIARYDMQAIPRVEYQPGSYVRLFFMNDKIRATSWHEMPFVDVGLD
jgi:hypothetical protein